LDFTFVLALFMKTFAINGAGLGLRRELLQALESGVPDVIKFFEVLPENWIDIGGRLGKIFRTYTEHLSFCSDDRHHSDLYPISFTEEAVRYVAELMRLAQDILERPIALENASYYVKPPLEEMDELTFINVVLTEADCDLHLNVNNIYVNSLNHHYDAAAFLKGLCGERI
jgi:uncharacterized protein (UPF0276 family)